MSLIQQTPFPTLHDPTTFSQKAWGPCTTYTACLVMLSMRNRRATSRNLTSQWNRAISGVVHPFNTVRRRLLCSKEKAPSKRKEQEATNRKLHIIVYAYAS